MLSCDDLENIVAWPQGYNFSSPIQKAMKFIVLRNVKMLKECSHSTVIFALYRIAMRHNRQIDLRKI